MAKNQVQISFKVFNEDFRKAMSEMRESTTRLNREFRLQREELKLTGSESDKLRARVDHLSKRYEQAQQRVELTQRQLERAKEVYGENSNEVRRLEDDLMNARIQEQRFANDLKVANDELERAESKTLRYGQSLQDVGDKIQDAGKKISDIGSQLNRRITVPILGAGIASAKLGMDFDKSMATIATLIPGQSKRLEGLKGDIQDVAITVGKSTDDIASGTYDVISAYGDAEDTMEKVEINAKAATAGLASTSDALALSSALMKGYGDTTAEANEKVMDLSFMTLKLGQTSFPELAGSIGKVVPTSNELGISQEELFAVFATGTGVTGNAAEVSTQYQGVLKALMSPTKDMTKLMQKMGYEDGKAMLAKEGLGGAIQLIVNEANKSGKPLQNYIGSINGQVLALALAGEQSDVFADKLDQLKNASGSMQEAFDEQTNTTAFTFEQAMIKMRVAGQEMADTLAPTIGKVADGFSGLSDKLLELEPAQRESIVKFAGMAAAVGPALKIFGPFVSIIGKAASGIGSFALKAHNAGGVMATLTPALGGLKTAFTVLTGPVGLTVAAIAGVVAGGVALVNHLRKDSIPAVELFGDEVSEATQEAVGGFLELEEEATVALNQLSWSGQEVTAEMSEGVMGNINGMKDQLVTTLEEQKDEALESFEEMFAGSIEMSEEEKERVLELTSKKFEDQIEMTEENSARIQEILDKAKEENRAITEEESREINRIKSQMKYQGIEILSEGEQEQMAIFERLQQETSKISALQASEVVKNSLEQKEETVKAAEEEYNERAKAAAALRAEGTEEAIELADAIMEEAKRQRDEAVSRAEEMHERVVEEAKGQAEEHIKYIDWETGEVKSKWEVMLDSAKKTAGEIVENMSDRWSEARKNTSKAWTDIRNSVEEHGGGAKGVLAAIEERMVQDWSNAWSTMDRLSDGKLSDMVKSTKDKMRDIRDRISDSKLARAWNKAWDFKLPKIKLPRLSVSGSFGITPPSVPRFNVKWQSEGAIFRQPTIFGGIGVGDAYKGIGRGMEAVLPISKLPGMIREALPIQEITAPQPAPQGPMEIIVPVYLDGREIARVTAPHMGVELNDIIESEKRGRW